MRHIRKKIRFGLGGRQSVLCFKLEFFININLVDNSINDAILSKKYTPNTI